MPKPPSTVEIVSLNVRIEKILHYYLVEYSRINGQLSLNQAINNLVEQELIKSGVMARNRQKGKNFGVNSDISSKHIKRKNIGHSEKEHSQMKLAVNTIHSEIERT
jgi:hypothetical protein